MQPAGVHGTARGVPREQAAQVHRVQAVDVLLGVDRGDGRVLVDAPWAAGAGGGCRGRPGRALIAAIGREQLGLRAALREEVVAGGDADLVGRALLVAHVDLRGGVLADQDDRERRGDAGRFPESRDVGLAPRPGPSPRPPCRRGSARRRSAGERDAQTLDRQPAPGFGIDADHHARGARPGPWRARTGSASARGSAARASSGSTPMTESVGPVMPRSVM